VPDVIKKDFFIIHFFKNFILSTISIGSFMQKYETVGNLSSIAFRRLIAFRKGAFTEMIAIVKETFTNQDFA
jgi:hypothetical protein